MSLQTSTPLNANQSNRQDELKVWSCINCRRRKVRCNRRHPCSPCTKSKSECTFPVSGRIPRRGRDANYPRPPAKKHVELLGRLRRLEAMIGDLGSQVENVESSGQERLEVSRAPPSGEIDDGLGLNSQSAGESSTTRDDDINMTSGPSDSPPIIGGSEDIVVTSDGDLVVGTQFWTVFCKEVEQIFEAVNGPTVMNFDHDQTPSNTQTPDNEIKHSYYNFLLRSASIAPQQENLYPLPSQMPFLWQIYTENIDPFMKILHVPTVNKIIRGLKGSYQSLSSSMQALVLAISFAAIMSLEAEEINMNFNTDKTDLSLRYRLVTEQALEKADFLSHPDVTVIQALAIYLGVLLHTGETRSSWILTGVLIRIAVSMKLHQDGSTTSSITPFDVELRRRLWWQICLIDSRSDDMQVSQFKISEGIFDTKPPINVDDTHIYPGMSTAPVNRKSWTDTTILLIGCEMWRLSRKLQAVPAAILALPSDIDQKIALFKETQARVEDLYLKHVDSTQPLQSLVAANARLFLTKVDFILHAKRNSTRATGISPSEISTSDKEFMMSLSIIEYTSSLQTKPEWRNWKAWSWQIQGCQPPWAALRTVFGHLCTRYWDPICERAWTSAKASFDSLPEVLWGEPSYQQLLGLVAVVERRRADILQLQHNQTTIISNSNQSVDSAMATSSALSASLAQIGIDGLVSPSQAQSQFFHMENSFDHTAHNSDFDLQLDWQNWDNISGNSSFWDVNNFRDGNCST